jgi:hypothetical protein
MLGYATPLTFQRAGKRTSSAMRYFLTSPHSHPQRRHSRCFLWIGCIVARLVPDHPHDRTLQKLSRDGTARAVGARRTAQAAMASGKSKPGLTYFNQGSLNLLQSGRKSGFHLGQNAVHLAAGCIAVSVLGSHARQTGQILNADLGAGQCDDGKEALKLFIAKVTGAPGERAAAISPRCSYSRSADTDTPTRCVTSPIFTVQTSRIRALMHRLRANSGTFLMLKRAGSWQTNISCGLGVVIRGANTPGHSASRARKRSLASGVSM